MKPLSFLIPLGALLLSASPAFSWYDVCNKTSNRVRVAVAYIGSEGYVSEGWWTIQPHDCKTVVGDGDADDPHHYWFYARDLEDGGSWEGDSDFCTSPERFTIVGKNCSDRGFDWTGFKHVESSSGNHTTNLTSRSSGQLLD